ncbi:uncharacterized protein LOC111095480 isoform X2 [Canis lupus familiaris]|uniref:uncharacterized protein LOC111095480 isoform X2 n=1 Tax=Canis lupus familiaris TaxID=9615 RepID=UPI0018F7E3CF|nr:uncharacterized protein LOC111095480 isoform X2 [Canis lupus familiaris]XP_038518801.1 uncharacterized protein LOC111095480 isoform X2 [Canis lupus familiaris]XP_038518802.1 uncharacterized protein LOC111095480 isoform X2 [Canis lupus familiaris]XP_038518803.1 uncharacterized protein LOC111095480 isoform X2 [Canis lupus familiaris]XP_038518804.1 uncharacterized protein LOC111095480 isoform X2 [Canis lupus familiaris]XP_038518805.1 uncharacterized protein LOC111095480 isoform X2 [Canis lupus
MGIRWFAEGSTPRHSHPVRSAGKTAAASGRPSFWKLCAGVERGQQPWPWPAPPSHLPLPPALLSCPCSSLTPAQTIVYQHRPEHSAASRNTHGDGSAIPRPAVNTLPRTVCRCQSCAHTHILAPSCQHSCSLLLGTGPSISHDTRVLCGLFSCGLLVGARTRAPGQLALCPLTWAPHLSACYCVTLGDWLSLPGHQMPRSAERGPLERAGGGGGALSSRREARGQAREPASRTRTFTGALAGVMPSVASFLESGHWFSFPTLGCRALPRGHAFLAVTLSQARHLSTSHALAGETGITTARPSPQACCDGLGEGLPSVPAAAAGHRGRKGSEQGSSQTWTFSAVLHHPASPWSVF